MTTLNARANQAYREMLTAEDLADGMAAFDTIPEAFEEGWETGYKAALGDLDRGAVDAALRQVIAHADYDLHKQIECDEETGEDTYAEHVDRFIAAYAEGNKPAKGARL